MKAYWRGICGLCGWALLASASAAEPRRYQLQFDWPENYEARVSFTRTRSQRPDTGPVQHREQGAYWLFAQPEGEGLLISVSALTLEHGEDPATIADNEALESFLDQLVRKLPRFRVSKQGQFVDLLDEGVLKANTEQAVAELLKDSPETVKTRYAQILEKTVAPEHLRARLVNDWNNHVGLWAGKQLETGKAYVVQRELSAPLLGPKPIAVTSRYRILGEVSCQQATPSPLCIDIEMTSSPTEHEMEALETRLFGGPLEIRDLVIISKQRLLTEPNTLIPHRSEHSLILRHAGMVAEEGDDSELIETRTKVYQYPQSAK